MREFAVDVLVELIPLTVLLAVGALIYAWHRISSRRTRANLTNCDYVIFEAEPINLPHIEADLASHGWRLVRTSPAENAAMSYRFEKTGTPSRCLSEIFDLERSMPRTANRITGTNSVIKIGGHGSSKDCNA